MSVDWLTKDEYLKKLKNSLTRTYDTKISFVGDHEMRSKICKCEITSLEDKWFGIHITQIFVSGKKYDVDHYFEFEPWNSTRISIRKCKYTNDGYYFLTSLNKFNTYDSWQSHFRECFHCLAKVLMNYEKKHIVFSID